MTNMHIGPTSPRGPEEMHRIEKAMPPALSEKTGLPTLRVVEFLVNNPRATDGGLSEEEAFDKVTGFAKPNSTLRESLFLLLRQNR